MPPISFGSIFYIFCQFSSVLLYIKARAAGSWVRQIDNHLCFLDIILEQFIHVIGFI